MQESTVVVFIMSKSAPDAVVLTIDGERYEYETSPFHIEKFKVIYKKSRLKALAYIKKNSSGYKKVEEPLWWLSFAMSGKGNKGVIITKASHARAALQRTKDLKICPEHDDLQVHQVSAEEAAQFPKDKLILPEDLKSKKYEVHKGDGQCPFHGHQGN